MAHKKDQIDIDRLPAHIAVIMDGNGRWAKKRGGMRLMGHRKGADSVRAITEACAELGVRYLSLYAFSIENWSRPDDEVSGLMDILVEKLENEQKTLIKNNIRLRTIGDITSLKPFLQKKLNDVIRITENCKRMDLILALNYSGRWDIMNACRNIALKIESSELKASEIDDGVLREHLTTQYIPDPELMIRTSGEKRISNFMIYQLAYSEFYFTQVLWPDFKKSHLYDAILDYQKRERRFGKTSEQI